jgi:hypothetical protein
MNKICTYLLVLLWACSYTTHAQDMTTIMVPDPQNPGETIACGQEGSQKDGPNKNSHLAYIGNPFKNQFGIPDPAKVTQVQIADLLKAVKTSKYSNGQPVQVSGYVYMVKPGGIESCNCATKDQAFIDTHIEITPDENNTGEPYRMIVEITPRMREIMEKQGIDWSTATLKEKIMKRHITVQGWLFYDEIHEPEAYANTPANPKDWRGSCWEIHPITALTVDDAPADADAAMADGEQMKVTFQAPLSPTITNQTKTTTMQAAGTPLNTLIILLIGAILGAVGQGIRVIIGLKKTYDDALQKGTDPSNLIVYQQLALSLFIAFGVGAVAGVLAVVTTDNIEFTRATIIAFIASGYAGTDFIEGFMKKYPDTSQKKVSP